jgi:hypothetical protein
MVPERQISFSPQSSQRIKPKAFFVLFVFFVVLSFPWPGLDMQTIEKALITQ